MRFISKRAFLLGMTSCFVEYQNAFSILKRLSEESGDLKGRENFLIDKQLTWTKICRKSSELGRPHEKTCPRGLDSF
jgi:hypothetical protein